MPSRIPILIAVCLFAVTFPAQASDFEKVAPPLIIVATTIGVFGGILAGTRHFSVFTGLGSSLAALAAVILFLTVVQASQASLNFGQFMRATLLVSTVISVAGAIPLALGYFGAFKITVFLHRRRGDAKGAGRRGS